MKKITCECYQFYEKDQNGRPLIRGKKPVYMTKKAACADVALPFNLTIPAHTGVKEDLWIGFEIPDGYKVVMYPRSSLLVKYGLMQPVSIIDADYSGQRVHVPLYNLTDKDVTLNAGTRVAQIECVPCYDCQDWEHENAERGIGGFGSTGA